MCTQVKLYVVGHPSCGSVESKCPVHVNGAIFSEGGPLIASVEGLDRQSHARAASVTCRYKYSTFCSILQHLSVEQSKHGLAACVQCCEVFDLHVAMVFYAPQLYRQVLLWSVLAMGIMSVYPSVCLSVTTRYAFKARRDRDSGSSPYDSPEPLVAKFRGDRPTELGDLALKKERNISGNIYNKAAQLCYDSRAA